MVLFILGTTADQIWRDKAGILRDNIPLVVGPTVPLDVITPICKTFGSKLIAIKDEVSFVNINNQMSEALYNEIINDCKEVPIHLDEIGIKEALKVAQPCRLELVPLDNIKELAPDLDFYPKALYLDVAHNPQGIKKLIKATKAIHWDKPNLKIYLIVSMIGTKDFMPIPLFTTMYMNSDDVKIVIFGKSKLIQQKEAQEIINKVKMSGECIKISLYQYQLLF